MRRSLLPTLPVLALGLALGACGGDDGTGPEGQTATIVMREYSFSPRVDTVEVGTTVRWRNDGNERHNSRSREGLWESGDLQPGQTYSRRFDQAGSFAYECTLHPGMGMEGTIVVE